MNVRMTASRRRLFLWTAAVLSSLGIKGLAQAHEGEDHSPQVTEDGFTTLVGPASLVDDLGQVLTEQVIIVKDTDNDQLLGVSPFCPHRGCAVDWDQENRQFFVPVMALGLLPMASW